MLLESMVAVVILGTVLVVTIQAMSMYLRKVSTANNAFIAATKGQELLVRVLNGGITPETVSGSFDSTCPGFSWQANVIGDTKYIKQYYAAVNWQENGTMKRIDISPYVFMPPAFE